MRRDLKRDKPAAFSTNLGPRYLCHIAVQRIGRARG
jgi:hypothetical protein